MTLQHDLYLLGIRSDAANHGDPQWDPAPVSSEEAWPLFWSESEFEHNFTIDELDNARTEKDLAEIGRKLVELWEIDKEARS